MVKYIVLGLIFQGIYSFIFIIAVNIYLDFFMKKYKESAKECGDKLNKKSEQVDTLLEVVKELNLTINSLKSEIEGWDKNNIKR